MDRLPARTVHGDADGTRQLIEVLLLHRNVTHADIIGGLHAAVTVGAISADVVAVEARKHSDNRAHGATTLDEGGNPDDFAGDRVASLTQRRLADPAAVIAGLPPDSRLLPSVAAYDQLLTRRRTPVSTIDSTATKGNVS